MKTSQMLTGAAVRRTPATSVGSGPRTKLPFLINVVRKAQKSASTTTRVPLVLSSAAPSSAEPPIPVIAFKPYPLLRHGETKVVAGSSILYKDDACVLVNDAFPKSMVHCLVMPLDLRIQSLNSLTKEDVPLLRHMMHVGDEYVRYLKSAVPRTYEGRRFIAGFHSLPSLPMLHLHVLSMDLDSPYLKTKKHYNSFATFFFLTAARVLEDLERHGCVTLNQDVARLLQMETQEMKCMWCGAALANVPTMKSHIQSCPQNKAVEK